MNGNGSGVRQITKGGKTNNFLGTWSKDGTRLSIGSNEQNTTGFDCFIYDALKGNYGLMKGMVGIRHKTGLPQPWKPWNGLSTA